MALGKLSLEDAEKRDRLTVFLQSRYDLAAGGAALLDWEAALALAYEVRENLGIEWSGPKGVQQTARVIQLVERAGYKKRVRT